MGVLPCVVEEILSENSSVSYSALHIVWILVSVFKVYVLSSTSIVLSISNSISPS